MEGVIYMATNKINGNCYIGKTIQSFKKRKMDHIAHAKRDCNFYFHRALRKYGLNNFKWEILIKANTEKELDILEMSYIEDYRKTKKMYNMTNGGEGASGRIYSLETRKKMSIANKGQIPWCTGEHLTDEHKKKLSDINKGKYHTLETRKKMSKSQKGHKHTEETKQKIKENHKGMSGKYHTDKTKQKISEAGKGNKNRLRKKHSIETKMKISESLKIYNTKKRKNVGAEGVLSLDILRVSQNSGRCNNAMAS